MVYNTYDHYILSLLIGNIRSCIMFAPFALVVFEQILDWANSNVSEYLIFFEHNCVCANSKLGKSVCKCQRAKITVHEAKITCIQ